MFNQTFQLILKSSKKAHMYLKYGPFLFSFKTSLLSHSRFIPTPDLLQRVRVQTFRPWKSLLAISLENWNPMRWRKRPEPPMSAWSRLKNNECWGEEEEGADQNWIRNIWIKRLSRIWLKKVIWIKINSESIALIHLDYVRTSNSDFGTLKICTIPKQSQFWTHFSVWNRDYKASKWEVLTVWNPNCLKSGHKNVQS